MGKKIYTAGFDLFAPDAAQRMDKIRALCVQYGFEPYYQPHDADKSKRTGETIFRMNLERIDNCDVVAANLNNYRGLEPDSGTAFEVGYAFAKGKPVFAYMDDTRDMVEKLGGTKDADGWTVENYGMPVNLMLGCAGRIVSGTLEDCLKVIVEEEKKK